METNFESLRLFIDKIKNISLFERIFQWGYVKKLFLNAYAEYERIANFIIDQKGIITELKSDNVLLKNNVDNIETNQSKTHDDLIILNSKHDLLNSNYVDLKQENTRLITEEKMRIQASENALANLDVLQTNITGDRNKEKELAHQKEINRLDGLKDTWRKHEELVKNVIKSICQKNTIQYIDKVPFKFEPDNTISICDEFIVFDAKSPGNDDVSNFPNYLKDQAEKAKKYAKQDGVKSDVFFVVPTNTLDYLETFVYKHGDHNVFIISLDSLEPVMLGLKKIEDYEFAEQLSPEDRENICRVIGRFVHISKRRIQVDNYFATQLIELASKCERDLPNDMFLEVVEFEKSEKLNPPQEKRAKAIPLAELEVKNKKLKQEAEFNGIIVEESTITKALNELPLYKKNDE